MIQNHHCIFKDVMPLTLLYGVSTIRDRDSNSGFEIENDFVVRRTSIANALLISNLQSRISNQFTQRCPRVFGPHQVLAHEKAAETRIGEFPYIIGGPDAAFGHRDNLPGDLFPIIETSEILKSTQIRLLTPISLRRIKPAEFRLNCALTTHPFQDVFFATQALERAGIQKHGDEKHGIGPGMPRLEYLIRINDKVLAQQRNPGAPSQSGKILESAVEMGYFGNNRERRGAGFLVRAAYGNRIKVFAEDAG
jgi:hypothetical protein